MCCNLKFWDATEHVEFRQVDGAEAADFVGVFDDVEVEPAALSLAASSGSKFVAN